MLTDAIMTIEIRIKKPAESIFLSPSFPDLKTIWLKYERKITT